MKVPARGGVKRDTPAPDGFASHPVATLIIDSEELAYQAAQRFESITKPVDSYHVVESRTQADGAPQLHWHTEEHGQALDYFEEPAPDAWKRIEVNVLSLFPFGVYASPSAALHSIVTLAHTDEDVDRTLEAAGKALEKSC